MYLIQFDHGTSPSSKLGDIRLVHASSYDEACDMIVREFPDARRFFNLTIGGK